MSQAALYPGGADSYFTGFKSAGCCFSTLRAVTGVFACVRAATLSKVQGEEKKQGDRAGTGRRGP